MHPVVDDHPALAAAVRALLSAGATTSEAADLQARAVAETDSIPVSRMDVWERAIRVEVAAAERSAPDTWWKARMRPRRFASWLDLCSHDGHKREAALRAISDGAPNAFILALAFRRLNDWVPQVRQAARETVPELVANSRPPDVADVLWNVFAHWNSWGRMETANRDTLIAVASSATVALVLRTRILRTTAGPAALVLSQCARSDTYDPWIQEFARSAVQPSVRARAFRWLFLGRTTWVTGYEWTWTDLAYCKGRVVPIHKCRDLLMKQPFTVTFVAAMADRSPMIRRVAAEFLIYKFPSLGEDALALAQRAASDTSTSVAERGRFVLKRLLSESSTAPPTASGSVPNSTSQRAAWLPPN